MEPASKGGGNTELGGETRGQRTKKRERKTKFAQKLRKKNTRMESYTYVATRGTLSAKAPTPEEALHRLQIAVEEKVEAEIDKERRQEGMCPLRLVMTRESRAIVNERISILGEPRVGVLVITKPHAFGSVRERKLFAQQVALQIATTTSEERVPFHELSEEERRELVGDVWRDVKFALQFQTSSVTN